MSRLSYARYIRVVSKIVLSGERKKITCSEWLVLSSMSATIVVTASVQCNQPEVIEMLVMNAHVSQGLWVV